MFVSASKKFSEKKARWIDTHAHLNFKAFDNDREEVIKRCLDNNLWVINVGSNFLTSQKAVEIARSRQGMFAAVGLHPINLDTGLTGKKADDLEGSHYEKGFDYRKYSELADSKRVVAIGEIGLDYYWKPKTKRKRRLFKEKQKELLSQELKLAQELNLPVIFHCRMAHPDLIAFLRENPDLRPRRAVAHSFVGKSSELQSYLDFGFYVGFNGIIFKNIEGIDFEACIRKTPLERMLLETDCPYLVPEGVDSKRNEPLFMKQVARKVADIKGLSVKRVAEVTTQSARRLFGL